MLSKINFILVFIFLISCVSGIKINEVEMNPEGADSGAEWVEIYCGEVIDLDGWKIMNADDDELELEGECSGYFIVDFEGQWLDNKDEKVFLYKGNELIDETETFSDSANDDKTWQFCDEWVFKEGTKGEENDCEKNEFVDEEEEEEEPEEEVTIEDKFKDFEIKEFEEVKLKNEIISLNSAQEIDEVVYESKNEKIKNFAIYGFALFLIFVIVFLVFWK